MKDHPMTDDDLCYMSAVEAIARFKARTLSPVELMAAVIARAEHDPATDQITINGVAVDPMIGWAMTYPFNVMSRCPVISVPSGRASNGVPTGIQIVGPTYDDVAVFRAAAAFERVRPWLDTAARRPSL